LTKKYGDVQIQKSLKQNPAGMSIPPRKAVRLPMTSLDDTSFAGRCANGDEIAWRDLMRRYGDLVFAVCFRVLGDRGETRDAAQETLVRAVKSISGFRRGGRLKPWLSKKGKGASP
jgi:hypothetical protein